MLNHCFTYSVENMIVYIATRHQCMYIVLVEVVEGVHRMIRGCQYIADVKFLALVELQYTVLELLSPIPMQDVFRASKFLVSRISLAC